MSITEQQRFELEDEFSAFLNQYYADDLADIVTSDREVLMVSYGDLYQFDSAIAESVLRKPSELVGILESVTGNVDLPITHDGCRVGLFELPGDREYSPTELRADSLGNLVSVRGMLSRVTAPYLVPDTVVFECQRCGIETNVEQLDNRLVTPVECSGCERDGPFQIVDQDTAWFNEVKLRVDSRPDESGNVEGSGVPCVVHDELIDYGGEHGLAGHIGEDVLVTGVVRHDQRAQKGKNSKVFDWYLDVVGVEFINDTMDIDVGEYKDRILEEAGRSDCLERFAQSIAPELYATDKWDTIFKLTVAYLFGSPRVDVPDGPTYRGDIHVAIISDPGMGKSLFTRSVELFSPKCERRSATGLASDVGLTAAAVQDSDFGQGEWTLKPGILVRGNGGHVIIDEIDKGPDNLERINDGLEGDQVISIDKGGISAKLRTRVGLLVTGNPKDGRFGQDEYATISEQIDVDPTLLSRFDGIVTMQDYADESRDKRISETVGRSYKESIEYESGEREELDELERDIPVELGRAWVKYARETVEPVPTEAAIEKLSTWFSEDARQLNEDKLVVPATMRQFETGLRLASAFARLRLSDSLELVDVDRAIQVSKELIGENYDKEANVFNASLTDEGQRALQSQKDKREAIVAKVAQQAEPISIDMLASTLGLEVSEVEQHVDKLLDGGRLFEPETGRYDTV